MIDSSESMASHDDDDDDPKAHRVTRRGSFKSWKSSRSITSVTMEEDQDSQQENPLETILLDKSPLSHTERRISEVSSIQVIPDCIPDHPANNQQQSLLLADKQEEDEKSESASSFTSRTRSNSTIICETSMKATTLNNIPGALKVNGGSADKRKDHAEIPAVQLLPDQFLPTNSERETNLGQGEEDDDSNSLTASIMEDLDLLEDLYGSGGQDETCHPLLDSRTEESDHHLSRMQLRYSRPSSTTRRKSMDVQLQKSRNRRSSLILQIPNHQNLHNDNNTNNNKASMLRLDDEHERTPSQHRQVNQRRTSFNSLTSREQTWNHLAQQPHRTQRHMSFTTSTQVEYMRESQNQSTEEIAHQNGSQTCILPQPPTKQSHSEKTLNSILKDSSNTSDDAPTKTVRFATNQSNRVWVVCHEYSVVPDDCIDHVWWDSDELQTNYQNEYDDIDEETEDAWGEALFAAFESVSHTRPNETNAILPFRLFAACQSARGLEKLVYAVEDHVFVHRQAVLETQQQMIQEIDGIDDTLFEEILSLRSFKYSHASRMVALQLGQLDASIVKLYQEQQDSLLSISIDDE